MYKLKIYFLSLLSDPSPLSDMSRRAIQSLLLSSPLLFLPFPLREPIYVYGYTQATVMLLILKLTSPVQISPLGSSLNNYTTIHTAFLLGHLMPLNNEKKGTLGSTLSFLSTPHLGSEHFSPLQKAESLDCCFSLSATFSHYQVLYILSAKYISIHLLLHCGEGDTISPKFQYRLINKML